MNVLYVTYDGLLEPLGESQVLAYVRRLGEEHRITVLSFEKKRDWADVPRRERMHEDTAAAGIRWIPLRYHKSPSALATAYDITVMIAVCVYLCLRSGVDLVHCRSYVAAVAGLFCKRALRRAFVFDMRGFWADERADAGVWTRTSRMYRIAKWFERQFLLHADGVVSLTEAGLAEIRAFDDLHDRPLRTAVIPTCVDLERFRLRENAEERAESGCVVGYAGTVTGWYLFEPAAQVFAILQRLRDDVRFVILNRGEHDFIRAELRKHGVDPGRTEIRTANFEDMPEELAAFDGAVFFIQSTFAKRASMPTKLGELLACGVPVLCNPYNTDMATILADGAGVSVDRFDEDTLTEGCATLLEHMMRDDVAAACREAAVRRFSLQKGVEAYDRLYRDVTRP